MSSFDRRSIILNSINFAATSSLSPRKQPAKMYTNPVWAHDFPDPHFMLHDGKVYAYATETPGFKFQVMESRDLVHWTHKGTAFTPPWSTEHYWAPEVVFHNHQFYMTYSAKNPVTLKHDIGIATCKSPTGPFRDQGILVFGADNKVGVIDATLYFEGSQEYILYSEEEPRRIVMKRMSPDLLSTIGDSVEIIKPDREWERNVTEAPTLIKRNGKYHLFYSAGYYQSSRHDASYCIAHALANQVQGPYTKTGALVATIPGKIYGPGHQTIIDLPSSETWIGYHAWDDQNDPRYGSNPLGRTLRIDRLHWSGDIPWVEGPSVEPRKAPNILPK